MFLLSAVFAQRSNLSGIKICIDPGHGGYGSNDRHIVPDAGTNFWESESNFEKAKLLKVLLEEKGAWVILTRNSNSGVTYPNSSDPEEPSLTARWELANANNVDWFHSIHSNATGLPLGQNLTTNYTLILVKEDISTRQAAWPQAVTMSDLIGPSIQKNLRNSSRTKYTYLDYTFYGGTSGGFNLGVLKGLVMPGELSEGSFHDHYPETRRLLNNNYRKMEAYALRSAFMQYYGVPSDTMAIVAGVLSERGSGKIMNNVKVRLLPEDKVFTGDNYNNGFYMFDSITPGVHTLHFETPGYQTDSVQVTLTASNTTFLDKQFESLAAPVITSNSPLNNDTSFAANGEIKFTFSKVMDTASVRSAFSITPSVKGNLVWSNSTMTLVFKPDSILLSFNTTFTIRIEASAKSESGFLLDGNGDGTPGDPFTLTFKTRPVDVWPPQLVVSLPGANAVLKSPNHIINLTFDEPLNPATVTLTNVAIQEIGGSLQARTLEYSEANGRGAINLYLTKGFVPGKSYRIRVSGVADVSGNAISTTSPLLWEFSIAPTSFEYTPIDSFDTSVSYWWQPKTSGSTVGVDSGDFAYDATRTLTPIASDKGAARLRYYWSTNTSEWLMREYLNSGTPRSVTWKKQGTRLQVYIYGDGSGTLFRFAVDDSVDVISGSTANHEVNKWTKIDWVGWRLVEWDLENDSVGSWLGNEKLEGLLRFDSFQLKYNKGASASSGVIYFNQLQLAKGTTTGIDALPGNVPTTFDLFQNYPNPFNPSTKIEYQIAQSGYVSLLIYDLLGREVRSLVSTFQQSGHYSVTWDGKDNEGRTLSTGMYIYRLRAGSEVLTKRMLLLK